MQPTVIATDLEGCLVPEIWIAVAERTGIPELQLTTRDIPDYDQLMQGRIQILKQHGLKLNDIQEVIASIEPLPGAAEYLQWIRSQTQLIILSDTFYEFASPLMVQLQQPTIFCHQLIVDQQGAITGYKLRMPDSKRAAVNAFKSLQFRVIAIGDSYNDTTMLGAADHGILFRPPANVVAEFPQFPVIREYADLQQTISTLL